jgi:uncharacterized protein
VWRIAAAAGAVPAALAAIWLSHAVELPVPRGLVWLAAIAAVALLVGPLPELRWRRWRYEIRPHEIDISRGVLIVTRTLVPISRIQHVDTERGPLQRAAGLATVTFHTAAGENAIPHLRTAEADRVRTRIAELTRAPDEL